MHALAFTLYMLIPCAVFGTVLYMVMLVIAHGSV